jgi:hypothetical protein
VSSPTYFSFFLSFFPFLFFFAAKFSWGFDPREITEGPSIPNNYAVSSQEMVVFTAAPGVFFFFFFWCVSEM